MEVISLDIKQKRFGWKDWFIQEPPNNTERLCIFLEKTFYFEIDPLFEIFEVESFLKRSDPMFIMSYLFTDENMLERLHCSSCFLTKEDKLNDLRYFKTVIKKDIK
jgi:hypothetical protein